MNIKHILRYGTHADKRYFASHFDDCYDIIAINANMIAFTPNAISTFVTKTTVTKPFFIDPLTHLFQHSKSNIENNKGEIKKSVEKLIDNYHINDDDTVESKYDYIKNQLLGEQIDEKFLKEFSKNVVLFQKSFLPEDIKKEYSKYFQYVPDLKIHTTPLFFVAPYLFIEDQTQDDHAFKKNIQFVNASKSLDIINNTKVFAQIVLDKKIFERAAVSGDNSKLEEIAKEYGESNADGYLIWIDKFDEHDQIAEVLLEYLNFLKKLKEHGKQVYALYGSYFSIILIHKDLNLLDGVGHGLEYGESRGVIPVGGGIPLAKYYFYPTHKRLNIKNVVSFLNEANLELQKKFYEQSCNTEPCSELLDPENLADSMLKAFGEVNVTTVKRGDRLVMLEYPTPVTKDRTLKHYLQSKRNEFSDVDTKERKDLISELVSNYKDYKGSLPNDELSHLVEWKKAIDVFLKNNE